ncbi:MAG: glutaredoxin-like protein [Rhizobacter sp.]|nr:glutaredoxin-like protein [Rhizobacter sp.]
MKSASRQFAPWLSLAAVAAVLLTALPAQALYKVIGPDGKVTYTDRPPVGIESKVLPLNSNGNVDGNVVLPTELRQAAQRYPVTLYVTSDCAPCDAGRDLLRRRGIPFAERTVSSNEDSEALQKLTGAAEAPAITIGAQVVRGLTEQLWTSYLDAAGYPKQSALPYNYQYGPATPLVARREATPEQGVPRPLGAAAGVGIAAPASPPPPASGGIRF